MRISELVGELLKVQQESGDLEVLFAANVEPTNEEVYGDQCEIAGLSTCVDEDDQALSVMICDRDTLDGFIDSTDPSELDFS